ncbi:hypothetical protein HD554DRAFT_2041183 [Boletus coccyginus]|nr:hypothetical protein HD554DRAFT_2041183 [Boletus coccyginus]
MPKVKPFLPFYDESSAPPAFPSLLTNQLELFGNTHHSPSLLADEILPPKSKSIMQIQSALPESHSHADLESLSEDSSSSSSLSDSPSDSKSTSMTLSEGSKILKPPGEPGCPGRGGYNLKGVIDWNHKVFTKFKNLALLKVICDRAMGAFPDLDNFSNCWPVTDLIIMHLKYTSSCARWHELEFAAGKAKRPPTSSVEMIVMCSLVVETHYGSLLGKLSHVIQDNRKFSWEWGNLVLDVQLGNNIEHSPSNCHHDEPYTTESRSEAIVLVLESPTIPHWETSTSVVRWHIAGSNAGVNSPICTYIRLEKSEEEGNEKTQSFMLLGTLHNLVNMYLISHMTCQWFNEAMETSLSHMFTMNRGATPTLITTVSP